VELDEQFKFGHLLLYDRKCRVCGEMKNLIDSFYQTRKDRGAVASSFSYECKNCTKIRILKSRKKSPNLFQWEYPDW
jgi:hypothetical protein